MRLNWGGGTEDIDSWGKSRRKMPRKQEKKGQAYKLPVVADRNLQRTYKTEKIPEKRKTGTVELIGERRRGAGKGKKKS